MILVDNSRFTSTTKCDSSCMIPVISNLNILGIAIGFGAQSLVRDFLAGVFIVMEDQYGVGDEVDLGVASGTVERISLRAVRLRDVLKGSLGPALDLIARGDAVAPVVAGVLAAEQAVPVAAVVSGNTVSLPTVDRTVGTPDAVSVDSVMEQWAAADWWLAADLQPAGSAADSSARSRRRI